MFLKMLNIVLPDITLLVTHPKLVKTYVHIKPQTQVFIKILFIPNMRWKQSEYLSTNKQVNKMWYI